ncbi:unnamed protein product [Allacma fusca]|uniref:Uncharacterized protein n=1 Tax=Allacma fusca TaxID=39272 RepID=A0A8J2K303_9HEXA|nr:unnamed protein product [Allacma fusca]
MINKWRQVKVDGWLVDHLMGLEDGGLFNQIEKNHSVEVEILDDLPGVPFAVIVVSGEAHSSIYEACKEIQRRVKALLGQ